MSGSRHVVRRVAIAIVAMSPLFAACAPSPTLTPQQQIAQIVAFVEKVRGHQFLTTPAVAFLPDATFQQAVLDEVASEEPAVNQAEVAFKALGWMPVTGSLWTDYQIAFSGGVVGFYDPTTKVLDVRGTDLTPYRREVIAHELTHALDDQLFGLNDDFHDGLLGEKTFASLIAIEGDAVRTQQAYEATLTPVEQAQDLSEQLSLGSNPQLLQVPLALLSFTEAPYLRGPEFADQIAATQGVPAGLDGMIQRLPATAEQAFDVSKYLADEPAVPVALPPADGTVTDSGTWGQYLLSLIIDDGLTLDKVDPATVGWAGDGYVTWQNGTTDCIRLDTQMDTSDEATAVQTALNTWASGPFAPAQVAITSTGPTTVRLTACD